jgi:hypothetical protein
MTAAQGSLKSGLDMVGLAGPQFPSTGSRSITRGMYRRPWSKRARYFVLNAE